MNWWRFSLGILLTACAGAIDAVSFVRLGAVYASFMSGNTVQIGIHAASHDVAPLGAPLGTFLTLVGLFVLGGFIGALLVAGLGAWHLPVILAIESASLAAAVALDLRGGLPLATTAPLAFAMGAQNHLVVLARGANPATTFVTGTTFRFADAVAQRVLGREKTGAWRFHLAVWLSFAFGAAAGTVSQVMLHDHALAPVLCLVVALTVVTTVVRLKGS